MKPQLQNLKFLANFSSSISKPKWNSSTKNLNITNPILVIMESCTTIFQLKQIQAHMTRTGLFFHTFPVSRLLSFAALSDAGDIRYASLLFSQISQPNVYIWNTLIRGYCKSNLPFSGFTLFRRMVRELVDLDERSFVFSVKACEGFSTNVVGKSVHCFICKVGFICDVVVQNGLIHFYADKACMIDAHQLFDESFVRDVVSWTTMIDGYAKQNCADEAMNVFDSMLLNNDVEPNEITMISVLSACSKKGDLSIGKSVHKLIEDMNLNCGINLMNAILDMYVKCGCMITSTEIFENMRIKDVFSWTSMINGYAKSGDLDKARKMFDEMPYKNVVSWNAMIAGYSQNNQPSKALNLFHEMVEEGAVAPIESTLVCVISACAQLGTLDLGRWIHHYYLNQYRIRFSVVLANGLIDMYSKCGCIDLAEEVFHGMLEKDLVSWNSMIVAYASHGHAKDALNLFTQMIALKFKPDDITFVGVLSACSHGGLVHEGREFFKIMRINFGLEPKLEHYACMIDMLGRIGQLEEAYNILKTMPVEPDEAAWGALLNACRMHGHVELGITSANKLVQLDPNDSGIYVLLANIYSKGRKWSDVKVVRSMMREREIKKTPGCSSIEIGGVFHEFLSADESHVRSKDIYRVLNEIILLSKAEDCIDAVSTIC